jgi:predicted transcriptional regulator
MPQPLASARRPRKRVISRSFRVKPDIDQALDEEARRRDWTKTFLIEEILRNWFSYHKAKRSRHTTED